MKYINKKRMRYHEGLLENKQFVKSVYEECTLEQSFMVVKLLLLLQHITGILSSLLVYCWDFVHWNFVLHPCTRITICL